MGFMMATVDKINAIFGLCNKCGSDPCCCTGSATNGMDKAARDRFDDIKRMHSGGMVSSHDAMKASAVSAHTVAAAAKARSELRSGMVTASTISSGSVTASSLSSGTISSISHMPGIEDAVRKAMVKMGIDPDEALTKSKKAVRPKFDQSGHVIREPAMTNGQDLSDPVNEFKPSWEKEEKMATLETPQVAAAPEENILAAIATLQAKHAADVTAAMMEGESDYAKHLIKMPLIEYINIIKGYISHD